MSRYLMPEPPRREPPLTTFTALVLVGGALFTTVPLVVANITYRIAKIT